jgi:cyclophilin family peptidyl-prolyl cis-trans isomerase
MKRLVPSISVSLFLASFCFFLLSATVDINAQGPAAQQPPTEEHAHDHEHGHEHPENQGAEAGGDLELRPDAGDLAEDDKSPLAMAYRKSIEDLRQFLKDSRKAIVEFHVANTPANDIHLKNWLEVCEGGHRKMGAVRKAAISLFKSNPAKYRSIGDMLFHFAKQDIEADRSEGTLEIMQALIDGGYEGKGLYHMAGYAAFVSNEYELAADYWKKSSVMGMEVPQQMLASLEPQAQKWKEELAKREKEAIADDLPRVEVLTTKGVLEIELFEDDAPETVNNFIYLVEKGHFNAKPIFRVIEHLVAQTGCERGDGTGTPGYSIKGEGKLPGHRNHFRGSVGLALGSDPETNLPIMDSGGAQFYITFTPNPQFDGAYCVFGRVIKGIEAIGNFTRVDMSNKEEAKKADSNPDAVVRIRVIRKRNHEYRPTPVEGRLLD